LSEKHPLRDRLQIGDAVAAAREIEGREAMHGEAGQVAARGIRRAPYAMSPLEVMRHVG